MPNSDVYGLDISDYAVKNSKEEIKDKIILGNATSLPWEDNYFDLVISITTLHNLYAYDLEKALKEMERVGQNKYLCVESYRNEEEKANLLYWQVTCESFNTPQNGNGGLKVQNILGITRLFFLNKNYKKIMEFQAAILTEQKNHYVVDNIIHSENLKIGQVLVELYVKWYLWFSD